MKNISNLKECLTFSDVLRLQAKLYPGKIWLRDAIQGRDYTFGDTDVLVDRAVSFLAQRGCRPADIISVILNNSLEYILLFLASLRLGAIFNPFPSNLSSHDVLKYLNYVGPRLVFCQNKHFDDLKMGGWRIELAEIETRQGFFLRKIKASEIFSGSDFLPAENDAACIYYSSGTTDNPKGVIYSHRNMIFNISSIVNEFGWKNDDCHLIVLPLGHTASINYSFLPCLYAGAMIVLFESFWKIRNSLWNYIRDFDATYIEVVPSILFSVFNTLYTDYDRHSLKRFKYIGCGSAPLPLDVQKKIEEKFQVRVANLYGLSETGPTHIDNPLLADWRPGSIGRPLSVNDVKIFDENGNDLGTGVTGEIAVKGPNVFVGYFKNERAYAQAFKNGYFCTGDLGYRDNDGLFYFVERKKDLIIKGGVNIFPGEIDEVIFSHPAVKETLTIGVVDAYLGERIKSFIVSREGISVTPEEIRRFCLEKLGDFKCPDEFIFIDEIPKGPSGKLLRKALREINRNA